MDLEEAIDHLKLHGTITQEWILEIIVKDDRSFEMLAEMLTYQKYHDNTNETYAPLVPVYALYMLAKIGTKRAQTAINSALVQYPDMMSDSSIGEQIHNVLAYMGPKTVDSLCHVVSLSSASIFSRYCAASALVIIALEHPQEKQKIIKTIRDAIQIEQDIGDRTFLMDSLVDLRDPDVSEYITDSLERGFVTNEFFDQGDLIKTYEDKSDMVAAKCVSMDPYEIFGVVESKITNQSDSIYDEDDDGDDDDIPYNKKPGRNDPCPCGSGKKYKKCCMPKPN